MIGYRKKKLCQIFFMGKQKLFLPMWGLYTAVIPPIYFAGSSDQHRPPIIDKIVINSYLIYASNPLIVGCKGDPDILVGAMVLLLVVNR